MWIVLSFKNYNNNWKIPKMVGGVLTVYGVMQIFYGLINTYLLILGFLFLGIGLLMYGGGAWMNYKTAFYEYLHISNKKELKQIEADIRPRLWQNLNEGERMQMSTKLAPLSNLERVSYLYYYDQFGHWPNSRLF